MKLEKDGDGWQLDLSIKRPGGGRSRIRRKVYGSRRDAQTWVNEIRNAAKKGTLVVPDAALEDDTTPKPLPFAETAWEWWNTYAKANNKPSEVKAKEVILRLHLIPFFGNQDIRSLRALDLERFKASKQLDVSPKTVNNMIICLKKLMNSLVEWEMLEKNPFGRVRKLRAMEFEWDFLTREESDALLQASDPRWRPFFAAAVWTGLRLGELLALRWDDINWRNDKLFVRRAIHRGIVGTPKSGKPREVPMNSKLALMLRELKLKSTCELVFASENNTFLDPSNIKRPYSKALRDAGLRSLRFHDLRHSFASQLVSAGVTLKVVQELLGHQSIQMTLRYAHLAPGVTKTAVEALVA